LKGLYVVSTLMGECGGSGKQCKVVRILFI